MIPKTPEYYRKIKECAELMNWKRPLEELTPSGIKQWLMRRFEIKARNYDLHRKDNVVENQGV